MRFCLISLALALLACDSESSSELLKIGIVLFGDSRLPQVNGFKKGMLEFGYKEGEHVEYIIRNANNDRSKLTTIVKELVKFDLNLMVAAGGLEADTMKSISSTYNTPVVVLYINAIKERGLVADRRNPGWEITGVDNLNAELSGKRVEIFKDLVPGIKRILILYYENITPSRLGVIQAQTIAAKYDINIDARSVSSREQIRAVMANLKTGEVDGMLTVPAAPIDNALKDIVLPNLQRLNIPLMTHSQTLAETGALASYGASFFEMGAQAARLADKIIQGAEPNSIPFETPKRFVYTLNRDVLQSLGLELNELTLSQINEYVTTVK